MLTYRPDAILGAQEEGGLGMSSMMAIRDAGSPRESRLLMQVSSRLGEISAPQVLHYRHRHSRRHRRAGMPSPGLQRLFIGYMRLHHEFLTAIERAGEHAFSGFTIPRAAAGASAKLRSRSLLGFLAAAHADILSRASPISTLYIIFASPRH